MLDDAKAIVDEYIQALCPRANGILKTVSTSTTTSSPCYEWRTDTLSPKKEEEEIKVINDERFIMWPAKIK